MKVMKFRNTFVRVTEKKAAELYLEGWVYASKSEWKRHNKTLNKKCERCWHSRPEVGSIKDHPQLCSRCLENIEGNGETRLYA